MKTYHVSPSDGEPRVCTAVRACPFGGVQDHYDSAQAARAAYEHGMSTFEERSPRSWQDEWFAVLSEEELSALSYYARPTHHRSFNERIRAGQLDSQDRLIMGRLDSALAKAPKGPPLRVARGLVLSPEALSSVEQNLMLFNGGYSSTTVRDRVGELFALGSGRGFVVNFTTRSRAFLDLGEGEILLPRNLRLRLEPVASSKDPVIFDGVEF